jgi:Tfp pilus assembly protein PilW
VRSGSEAGQTLIEMLIAATVALIIVGVVADLTISALHSQSDQTNRLTAQQDVRLAVDRMKRQIHCGQTATTGAMDTVSASGTLVVTMNSSCSTTGTVTWCVVPGSGGLYTLKSSAGACDATHGTPLVKSITSATPFTVTPAGTTGTTLRANVDSLGGSFSLPVVSISGLSGTNVFSVGASPTSVTCTGTSGTGPLLTGCSGGSGGPYSKGTWVVLSGQQQFRQVGINLAVRSTTGPNRSFRLQDTADLRNSTS